MKKTATSRIGLILAVCIVMAAAAVLTAESAFAASPSWPSFRGNDSNNGVTEYSTPTDLLHTEPVWVRNFGKSTSGMSGWDYAPNTPIIVDGKMITTSKKSIMKLSLSTGKTMSSGTLDDAVDWGYTPVTYAEELDILFCPLKGGKIEAVDNETLKKVWTFNPNEKTSEGLYKWGLRPEETIADYKEEHRGAEPPASQVTEDGTVIITDTSVSHQSVSPILYSDGIIYTGFFPDEYHYYDYFVAIAAVRKEIVDPVSGETRTYEPGELIWKYKSKGGFYWDGAVAIGDAVIVGTQDGAGSVSDYDGVSGGTDFEDSHIIAFNKQTGEIISDITLPRAGDICSSIVYDNAESGTGRIYWTACGGFICSAEVDPVTGEISNVLQRELTGTNCRTVSTPAVYDGRIYFGYTCKEANGRFAVFSYNSQSNKMKEELIVDLPRLTKSSPLLCTAYEKKTRYLYAYMADYNKPGGVTVIRLDRYASDPTDEEDVKVSELFQANGYSQYGTGSLIADEKGHLYFKNDSQTIFAMKTCGEVSLGKIGSVTLTPGKTKVTVKFRKISDATGYRLLYRINETGSWKRVDIKTNTNKYNLKVKNPRVVTVRIKPVYLDAAKSLIGKTYSDDVTTYNAYQKIKKLKKGKGSFTIKYAKHYIADGYQIEYSTRKNMYLARTVSRRALTSKGKPNLQCTVKGLMSKTTYYVRVRSYKKIGTKKRYTIMYGNWSSKKKVKTK